MRKVYGEYKKESCVFCGATALNLNKQKFPVCSKHRHDDVDVSNLKCVCGSYLDLREGKFGVFFVCINCGTLNLNKVLSINKISAKSDSDCTEDSSVKKTNTATYKVDSMVKTSTIVSTTRKKDTSNNPREVTIRSDDPNYF